MNRFNRIMGITLMALMIAAIPPATAQETASAAAPLTLDQAMARALGRSPLLGAASEKARAAAAGISAAAAYPNPELSIEAENIYGDYDGLDDAEITYGIAQLVELPGKRRGRAGIASAEKMKSEYERDALRLDLIRDVTIAYAEAAAARQDVLILTEEYALATAVHDSVAAKVDAGKEPPLQKNRVRIEQSASRIALEQARRHLDAKNRALSSLMGETWGETERKAEEEAEAESGDFGASLSSLPAMAPPAPWETYRASLPQTPDARSLDAAVRQARAALSLEKAGALPDPTFSFGVRDFRGDDRQAFVAGVSLPLPVLNANRAGVARAAHALKAEEHTRESLRLSLDAALAASYGAFANAYNEAVALETAILPGAEEAFRLARAGYDAGKFDYLEVLDAQRTLFKARRQYNAAILDYHRGRAVMERMTALHAEQHAAKEKDHD